MRLVCAFILLHWLTFFGVTSKGYSSFRAQFEVVLKTCLKIGYTRDTCDEAEKGGIAFTAKPSSDSSYSSGKVVRFDSVSLNKGNGFSGSSYKFTAPSSGLYVFSWSIAMHSSYYGNMYIMEDSNMYAMTYCYGKYLHCGSTVAMNLKKNSQVYLRTSTSSTYVRSQSVFSGWKVQ